MPATGGGGDGAHLALTKLDLLTAARDLHVAMLAEKRGNSGSAAVGKAARVEKERDVMASVYARRYELECFDISAAEPPPDIAEALADTASFVDVASETVVEAVVGTTPKLWMLQVVAELKSPQGCRFLRALWWWQVVLDQITVRCTRRILQRARILPVVKTMREACMRQPEFQSVSFAEIARSSCMPDASDDSDKLDLDELAGSTLDRSEQLHRSRQAARRTSLIRQAKMSPTHATPGGASSMSGQPTPKRFASMGSIDDDAPFLVSPTGSTGIGSPFPLADDLTAASSRPLPVPTTVGVTHGGTGTAMQIARNTMLRTRRAAVDASVTSNGLQSVFNTLSSTYSSLFLEIVGIAARTGSHASTLVADVDLECITGLNKMSSAVLRRLTSTHAQTVMELTTHNSLRDRACGFFRALVIETLASMFYTVYASSESLRPGMVLHFDVLRERIARTLDEIMLGTLAPPGMLMVAPCTVGYTEPPRVPQAGVRAGLGRRASVVADVNTLSAAAAHASLQRKIASSSAPSPRTGAGAGVAVGSSSTVGGLSNRGLRTTSTRSVGGGRGTNGAAGASSGSSHHAEEDEWMRSMKENLARMLASLDAKTRLSLLMPTIPPARSDVLSVDDTEHVHPSVSMPTALSSVASPRAGNAVAERGEPAPLKVASADSGTASGSAAGRGRASRSRLQAALAAASEQEAGSAEARPRGSSNLRSPTGQRVRIASSASAPALPPLKVGAAATTARRSGGGGTPSIGAPSAKAAASSSDSVQVALGGGGAASPGSKTRRLTPGKWHLSSETSVPAVSEVRARMRAVRKEGETTTFSADAASAALHRALTEHQAHGVVSNATLSSATLTRRGSLTGVFDSTTAKTTFAAQAAERIVTRRQSITQVTALENKMQAASMSAAEAANAMNALMGGDSAPATATAAASLPPAAIAASVPQTLESLRDAKRQAQLLAAIQNFLGGEADDVPIAPATFIYSPLIMSTVGQRAGMLRTENGRPAADAGSAAAMFPRAIHHALNMKITDPPLAVVASRSAGASQFDSGDAVKAMDTLIRGDQVAPSAAASQGSAGSGRTLPGGGRAQSRSDSQGRSRGGSGKRPEMSGVPKSTLASLGTNAAPSQPTLNLFLLSQMQQFQYDPQRHIVRTQTALAKDLASTAKLRDARAHSPAATARAIHKSNGSSDAEVGAAPLDMRSSTARGVGRDAPVRGAQTLPSLQSAAARAATSPPAVVDYTDTMHEGDSTFLTAGLLLSDALAGSEMTHIQTDVPPDLTVDTRPPPPSPPLLPSALPVQESDSPLVYPPDVLPPVSMPVGLFAHVDMADLTDYRQTNKPARDRTSAEETYGLSEQALATVASVPRLVPDRSRRVLSSISNVAGAEDYTDIVHEALQMRANSAEKHEEALVSSYRHMEERARTSIRLSRVATRVALDTIQEKRDAVLADRKATADIGGRITAKRNADFLQLQQEMNRPTLRHATSDSALHSAGERKAAKGMPAAATPSTPTTEANALTHGATTGSAAAGAASAVGGGIGAAASAKYAGDVTELAELGLTEHDIQRLEADMLQSMRLQRQQLAVAGGIKTLSGSQSAVDIGVTDRDTIRRLQRQNKSTVQRGTRGGKTGSVARSGSADAASVGGEVSAAHNSRVAHSSADDSDEEEDLRWLLRFEGAAVQQELSNDRITAAAAHAHEPGDDLLAFLEAGSSSGARGAAAANKEGSATSGAGSRMSTNALFDALLSSSAIPGAAAGAAQRAANRRVEMQLSSILHRRRFETGSTLGEGMRTGAPAWRTTSGSSTDATSFGKALGVGLTELTLIRHSTDKRRLRDAILAQKRLQNEQFRNLMGKSKPADSIMGHRLTGVTPEELEARLHDLSHVTKLVATRVPSNLPVLSMSRADRAAARTEHDAQVDDILGNIA